MMMLQKWQILNYLNDEHIGQAKNAREYVVKHLDWASISDHYAILNKLGKATWMFSTKIVIRMFDKFSKIWDLNNIDRTLAILGAIASIVLILFLAMRTDRAEYLLIGFLVLASCLLWLLKRKSTNSLDLYRVKPYLNFKICVLSYILLFILSVLILFAGQACMSGPFSILSSLL